MWSGHLAATQTFALAMAREVYSPPDQLAGQAGALRIKGRCSDLLVIVWYVPVELTPILTGDKLSTLATLAWIPCSHGLRSARCQSCCLMLMAGWSCKGWETALGKSLQTSLQIMIPASAHGGPSIIWQLPTHKAEDAALLSMVRLAIPRARTMMSFLTGFCSTSRMCECGAAPVIAFSPLTVRTCVITCPIVVDFNYELSFPQPQCNSRWNLTKLGRVVEGHSLARKTSCEKCKPQRPLRHRLRMMLVFHGMPSTTSSVAWHAAFSRNLGRDALNDRLTHSKLPSKQGWQGMITAMLVFSYDASNNQHSQ